MVIPFIHSFTSFFLPRIISSSYPEAFTRLLLDSFTYLLFLFSSKPFFFLKKKRGVTRGVAYIYPYTQHCAIPGKIFQLTEAKPGFPSFLPPSLPSSPPHLHSFPSPQWFCDVVHCGTVSYNPAINQAVRGEGRKGGVLGILEYR